MSLHIFHKHALEKKKNLATIACGSNCTYGASIESPRHRLQMYSTSDAYILNVLNLLSASAAPDGSKDENKVNMVLNALSIRNVGARI